MPPLFGSLASFRPLKVYRLVIYRGDGSQADPMRYLTHYIDEDGRVLAIFDPADTYTYVAADHHADHGAEHLRIKLEAEVLEGMSAMAGDALAVLRDRLQAELARRGES